MEQSTELEIIKAVFAPILRWWKMRPLAERFFAAAILLYFVTRLVGITEYPIYFFCDEAAHAVLASDLVRDAYRGWDGVWLPTFFQNNGSYILGTSVYVQLVPYLLFGRSMFLTRLAPMVVTVAAGVWVGLTLRDIFKGKYWWLATLFLSITPAWFLHSRTAFTTALFATFFAGFLYHYLRYRSGSPKHLYPALALGSVAFYSYSPGQVVIVVCGALLFVLDIKTHWQNRRMWWKVLLTIAICVFPFVRFLVQHPTEYSTRLTNYQSYWLADASFWEKMLTYAGEYFKGLSPGYWFFPNATDFNRHVMTGYGNIHWLALPFILIGLWVLIRRFRAQGTHWAVLVAMAAAPAGAAAIAVGITRVLMMVIPAAILAGLGMDAAIEWLGSLALPSFLKRENIARLVFILLACFNLYLLFDALRNGPTWSEDYSLYGMQWGAPQVMAEIQRVLAEAPDTEIDLSPNWGNNIDILARFFLEDPLPVTFYSLDGFSNERRSLNENSLLVMTPEEYASVLGNEKFTDIRVEKTLFYPNQKPGFYFVRARYTAEAEAIFAVEEARKYEMVPAAIELDGVQYGLSHSYLDMGEIIHMFDGRIDTLARTGGANPLVLDFVPTTPISLENIRVRIGSSPTRVELTVYPQGSDIPLEISRNFEATTDIHGVTIVLKTPVLTDHMIVRIYNSNEAEPSHVHLWELEFNRDAEE